MTAGARSRKDRPTALDIGGVARRRWCGVGRRLVVREGTGSAPLLLDPLGQNVDLLIRERAAGAERERRLGRARDAGRNDLAQPFGWHHREIDRIVQWTRRSEAS